MKNAVLFVLRGYKKVFSPFLGVRCRFYPSCSDYASAAIVKHGLVKGMALAARRLMKCHPFHEGGIDHVP